MIFAILVVCSVPWRMLLLHLLSKDDGIFLLWCLKWAFIGVLDPGQGQSTLAAVLAGLMGFLKLGLEWPILGGICLEAVVGESNLYKWLLRLLGAAPVPVEDYSLAG